jgi:hypothetical protein
MEVPPVPAKIAGAPPERELVTMIDSVVTGVVVVTAPNAPNDVVGPAAAKDTLDEVVEIRFVDPLGVWAFVDAVDMVAVAVVAGAVVARICWGVGICFWGVVPFFRPPPMPRNKSSLWSRAKVWLKSKKSKAACELSQDLDRSRRDFVAGEPVGETSSESVVSGEADASGL